MILCGLRGLQALKSDDLCCFVQDLSLVRTNDIQPNEREFPALYFDPIFFYGYYLSVYACLISDVREDVKGYNASRYGFLNGKIA